MMIIILIIERSIFPGLWASQWLPGVRLFKDLYPCLNPSFTKIHKERSLNLLCLWHPFIYLHCPLLFSRLFHCCLRPGCKAGHLKKLGARNQSFAAMPHHMSGRQWGPKEKNWDPDQSESQIKYFGVVEMRSEELPTYESGVCKVSLQLFPWWLLLLLRQSQMKITSTAPTPASVFSGLQAAKVTSILTCREGLCRGPLRAGSPIALGNAQTRRKPVESSRPCETPHKCILDNLDILQCSSVHISPAVFWNTFFCKTALAVAIFLSTQMCLLTKHQQCQTLFRGATAS